MCRAMVGDINRRSMRVLGEDNPHEPIAADRGARACAQSHRLIGATAVCTSRAHSTSAAVAATATDGARLAS